MPRQCTICSHDQRESIDKALVAGKQTYRLISSHFDVSDASLRRHKANHIPELLTRLQDRQDARAADLHAQVDQRAAAEDSHALDVMRELQECFETARLLRDACDRYLRDPDDPSRYDLSPRAENVQVVYVDRGPGGPPVRRKAHLDQLLDIVQQGLDARTVRWEIRRSDPADVILKSLARLTAQIDLLAKVLPQDPSARASSQLDALMADIRREAVKYEQQLETGTEHGSSNVGEDRPAQEKA